MIFHYNSVWTPKTPWRQLSATVALADFPGATTLTAAASLTPVDSRCWDLNNDDRYAGSNLIQVAFAVTGAANTKFDVELLGHVIGGDVNTPLLVYSSNASDGCITGTQYASATELWCDTLPAGITGPFDVSILDSGNNRIAIIEFDAKGIYKLQCNLINTNADVTSVRPMSRGY